MRIKTFYSTTCLSKCNEIQEVWVTDVHDSLRTMWHFEFNRQSSSFWLLRTSIWCFLWEGLFAHRAPEPSDTHLRSARASPGKRGLPWDPLPWRLLSPHEAKRVSQSREKATPRQGNQHSNTNVALNTFLGDNRHNEEDCTPKEGGDTIPIWTCLTFHLKINVIHVNP